MTRPVDNVFHLAIPCRDLEEARRFYVDQLGCLLARRYADRITLNFFGDQVVCHLLPNQVDPEPRMYPRHFGVTFRDEAAFLALHARAKSSAVPFFKEIFVRFAGQPEEHRTFFLCDPSNNLLEFKHYGDPAMMY